MKLTTVRLRINPRAQPAKRRRRRTKKRAAPAAAKRRPARRPAARLQRSTVRRRLLPKGKEWLVEVLKEKNRFYSFHYLKGAKLIGDRTRATKFATEAAAVTAGRALIKKLASVYRFVRVVPA